MNGRKEALQAELTRREALKAELARRQASAPLDQFKQATGMNEPPLSADIAGGLLSNATGLMKSLPDMNQMVPEKMQKFLPYQKDERPIDKFDPYAAMGTRDKSITEPGGGAQALASLYMPGGGAAISKYAPKIASAIGTGIGNAGKSIWNKMPGVMANNIEKHIGEQTKQISENVSQRAKGVAQELSKGHETVPEVSESIANDIRAIHDPRAANASSYYEYALNAADRERKLGIAKGKMDRGLLYQSKLDPLISTAPQQGVEIMSQIKEANIGNIGKKFTNEPTLRNAHNLRQEVGLDADEIKRNPFKTPEDKLKLNKLNNIYKQLTNDMKNYMENLHPNQNEDLMGKWSKGEDIWQRDVKPLLHNKKLREINRPTMNAGGRKAYVKNIHQAFEDPGLTDVIMPNGEKKLGDASNLLKMLPEETRDKILFRKMGLPSGSEVNPLVKSLMEANKSGYGHLAKPSIKQALNDILTQQGKLEELNAGKEQVNELRKRQKFINRLGGGSFLLEEYMRRNR